MQTIPYTVSPERTNDIRQLVKDGLAEISTGYDAIVAGKSRIALMQGIGRIEAACAELTATARLIR